MEVFPRDISQGCAVRLYQFESCPFCRKVRATLDYVGVPYVIVEVHPLSKAETKGFASDYRKVPIVRVDYDDGQSVQMRDSKTILRALLGPEAQPTPRPPARTPTMSRMWPEEPQAGAEEEWIKWTDKVLVQCIVLNVYRTMEESAETFQYLLTHPSFSWAASRAAAWSGTVMMWGVAKARQRKWAIEDERAALYEAAELFADAVREGGGPFFAGPRPGRVDFNVYGILRSTESFQTERDLVANCKAILPWYEAMHEAVGSSKAQNLGEVVRGMYVSD